MSIAYQMASFPQASQPGRGEPRRFSSILVRSGRTARSARAPARASPVHADRSVKHRRRLRPHCRRHRLTAGADQQILVLIPGPIAGAETVLNPDDAALVDEAPAIHDLERVRQHRHRRPQEQHTLPAAMSLTERAAISSVRVRRVVVVSSRSIPVSRDQGSNLHSGSAMMTP